VALIDTTDPQIAITTPPQGATYTLGQSVAASYSCTDADSGVASYEGPVADGTNIDTSSTGAKSGTSNSETLIGTSEDDVICGLGGNDILKGLEGNDTLQGGVGDDTPDSGSGTDTASYSASLTALSASLATLSSTGKARTTSWWVWRTSGDLPTPTPSPARTPITPSQEGAATTN
jgi:hypothetical protein